MTILVRSIATIGEFVTRYFPWRAAVVVLLAVLLATWMYFSPEGVLGKADAIGYAVCHRIDSRSFHIGDIQFSVCARCTGQYLGAVLGVLFLALFRRKRVGRPPWPIIGILTAWVILYAIDGFNSFLHLMPGTEQFWLYEPHNTLRLITGMGMGLGISMILFPAINQTLLKVPDRQPTLEGFRDFGLLILSAIVLVLLVLSENPVILYPLSLISAGGVLMLLTMVYTMVWVMLVRAEGKFDHLRQYFYPILAGLTTALVQILAIDYIRYLLTGTWGEFILG